MSDGIQFGMTGTNQVESGEVKVDRDGEGSLTKEGEERWRVMRSRLRKMASPRGGPRDNEV